MSNMAVVPRPAAASAPIAIASNPHRTKRMARTLTMTMTMTALAIVTIQMSLVVVRPFCQAWTVPAHPSSSSSGRLHPHMSRLPSHPVVDRTPQAVMMMMMQRGGTYSDHDDGRSGGCQNGGREAGMTKMKTTMTTLAMAATTNTTTTTTTAAATTTSTPTTTTTTTKQAATTSASKESYDTDHDDDHDDNDDKVDAIAALSSPTPMTGSPSPPLGNNNHDDDDEDDVVVFVSGAPTATTTAVASVAIVLNTNARGVSPSLVETARQVVADATISSSSSKTTTTTSKSNPHGGSVVVDIRMPPIHLYVTTTPEEAADAAKAIVKDAQIRFENDGCDGTSFASTLIIPVGGDGTLTSILQLLWHEQQQQEQQQQEQDQERLRLLEEQGQQPTPQQQQQKPPPDTFPFLFGYIAMGTGNALGSVVGCQPTAAVEEWTTASSSSSSTSSSTKRRRGRLQSLIWRLLRPRRAKLERFRTVLTQLLQAAAILGGGHAGNDVIAKSSTTSPSSSTSSFPTPQPPIDIVDLPLIRLTTTRVDLNHGPTNSTTSGTSNTEVDVDVDVDVDTTTTKPPLPQKQQQHHQVTKDVHYSFFAGVGFDSLMLQDYKDLQDWSKTKGGPFLKDRLAGVVGYTVALFTRTLPKYLTTTSSSSGSSSRRQQQRQKRKNKPVTVSQHKMRVEVSTDQPESTYWIDHRRGDFMRPVISNDGQKGGGSSSGGSSNNATVLYRGSAGIVAGGTAPYYGGGLRLFPFARMGPTGGGGNNNNSNDSTMHLRIGRIHPLRGVVNIPKIFAGSYRDMRLGTFGCLDFVGPSFQVRILDDGDEPIDDGDGDDDSSKSDEDVKEMLPYGPSSSNRVETTDIHRRKEGYPVQHSGESVGRCSQVDFLVSNGGSRWVKDDQRDGSVLSRPTLPPPIRFLTLMPPRLVYENNATGNAEDA